jgi:hypothetical protein
MRAWNDRIEDLARAAVHHHAPDIPKLLAKKWRCSQAI